MCSILLIVFAFFTTVNGGAARNRLFGLNDTCAADQFPCSDGKCIPRSNMCDKTYHCKDRSDEDYCRTSYNCPKHIPYVCTLKEISYKRCLPMNWICNGYTDCYDRDEKDCANKPISRRIPYALSKAKDFLESIRDDTKKFRKWSPGVPKIATALSLANGAKGLKDYDYGQELSYEIGMEILARQGSKKLSDVSSSELASFLHALLVTCVNPRDFFAMDLVEELRQRVFDSNFTHPFVMLSLCNAGERITKADIEGLVKVFWKAAENRWTDTQALTVLALSCAAQQTDSVVDIQDLTDYTLELKNRQFRNGTVENLKTTALVMQAILSSEPESDEDNFDEERALRRIIEAQSKDGSFGNIANTYYVLPVLARGSLANISSKHCTYTRKNEQEALWNLAHISGKKRRVYYSVWIGDNRIVEKTLSLQVPENTTFYRIMEYAADLDSKYGFEYTMRNNKPYPYSISGIQDDPENQLFWGLYTVTKDNEESVTPITKSPADVTPENKQHLVYWYKRRIWNSNDI